MKRKVKTINILLQILKYTFLLFVIFSTVIFIGLVIYSKNLNYQLPKVVQIEIYDSDEKLMTKVNNSTQKSYVRIDNINQNIINCFLTIEDKDYYNHQGVNIKRIIGALIYDLKVGSFKQGASTITQQYVKNVFLTSKKTLKRKFDEAMIAIHLETKYTKDEILEGYLNTIYFDHGLTGINDACLFYFNKSPSEVTINEAASLASIVKSPSNYSPIKNYEKNNERRKLILSELYKDKIITLDEYNNYVNENLLFYGKLDNVLLNNSPFFIDVVLKELKTLNLNYQNGLKIFTTNDTNLNTIINHSINKYIEKDNDIELALVALDSMGNVLSLVGGKDYLNSTYNRCFSLRQPGSTVKPFLYYAALNNGFNVCNTFYSGKTSFNINGELYSPRNYSDIYPNQDISMIYAIATSDNIYAMKTHLFLGTSCLYNTLLSFGFNKNIKNNPSLALGTSEVSLMELVSGYQVLSSSGISNEPTYIKKVLDLNDKPLYQKKYNNTINFDSSTIYLLSEALTNVFDPNIRINTSPTCSSISSIIKSKYAAKSGSTDYDGWIIGYNPNFILGIWSGYDDNRILKNKETKYIKYIWADIIKEYNDTSWYECPNDVLKIMLNPITGNFAYNDEYKKYLYFKNNNLPEIDYFKWPLTIE